MSDAQKQKILVLSNVDHNHATVLRALARTWSLALDLDCVLAAARLRMRLHDAYHVRVSRDTNMIYVYSDLNV